MNKLLIIACLLGWLGAAAQYPKGKPYPYSNGFVQYGYLKSDSALIVAKRDTNWTPRFAGTVIYWERPGVDSALWKWDVYWSQITFSDQKIKSFVTLQRAFDNGNALNRKDTILTADSFYIRSPFVQINPPGSGVWSWNGQTMGLRSASNATSFFIGNTAGQFNTGNSNYGLGTYALQFGAGSHNLAIGTQSSPVLNGSRNVTVGDATGFTTDLSDNVMVGYSAGLSSYPSTSTMVGSGANTTRAHSTVTISTTNIALGTVKIGGLTSLLTGLTNGYVGTISVVFNGTRASVAGAQLADDIGNKFVITSPDTIALGNFGVFTAKGTGTITVTVYESLSNSVAIGYLSAADSSNQVALGNTNTAQIRANKVRIKTSVVPTEGQIFRYRGTEFVPESLPKVYTALVDQTGTSAPVVDYVLENTLGSVPTYGYQSVGSYTINFNQTFSSDKKVTVEVKTTRSGAIVAMEWDATGVAFTVSSPWTGAGENDQLLQAIVEIKYYP